MKSKKDSLHSLINNSAEQSRLILGLKKNDSDCIINEIINEPSILEKLSKLLFLLIERLSSYHHSNNNNFQSLNELIKNFKINLPEIPTNFEDFSNWIPNTILNYKNEINELKNENLKIEKKFINLIEENKKLKEKQNFIIENKNLEIPNKNLIEENKNIIEENKNIIEENKKLKKKIDLIEENKKLKEKQNFINENKNLEIPNKNLIEENKKLIKKIENLKKKNKYYSNELNEIKNKMNNFTEIINNLKSQIIEKEEYNNESLNSTSNDIICQLSEQNKSLVSKFSEEVQKSKEKDIEIYKLKRKIEESNHDLLLEEINNLKNNLNLLKNQNYYFEEEKIKFEKELKEKNCQYEIINERCLILKAEINTLNEEKKKLINQINNFEKNSNYKEMISHKQLLEKDSMMIKLKDLENNFTNTNNKLITSNEEIKRLNRECLKLETLLTKTKDELFMNKEKCKMFEEDYLTLKKFGFLLADTLNTNFNPNCIECEIERLISLIKFNNNSINLNNNSFNSKFDDLNNEISLIQLNLSKY